MSPSRRASISKKLTRMNLLVSAVALVLACSGFVAYDLVSYRSAIVRNLSIQAQVAGSNSVSALLFDDARSAEKTLSSLSVAPSIVSACTYTADGSQFASYRRDKDSDIPASPPIAPGQQESYWYENGNVMLTHTIFFQGKLTGYVFVRSDLHALVARLQGYIVIAAGMLALSLLAALFVSRIARRSIAEPIVNLAEVAREVSRERTYSVRAERGREEGELAELVETFNEMLGQIESRDHSLQAAHDELEKRVEERTAELAAANKELESFAYSVSHDLRAPLRSIDGFSQALAEDYSDKLDEQGKNYVVRVQAATKRMGILIDDLLNLSRVTRAEINRERTDLSAIARSIAAELAKTDHERQVEWIIADGAQAFGDPRLLRIVLDNLIGNAWKYSSKHSHSRIEFGTVHNNGSSVFFVKDDGAGFDAQYSQRLFGAFQRLHGMTEFPGTGIGLATVQRIVRRHGGDVWAEGAIEEGATFYFSL